MVLTWLCAGAAAQATFEVGLDVAYPTITSAVNNAVTGDLIRIHAGLGPTLNGAYSETITIADARALTFEGVADLLGTPPLLTGSANDGALRVSGPRSPAS